MGDENSDFNPQDNSMGDENSDFNYEAEEFMETIKVMEVKTSRAIAV